MINKLLFLLLILAIASCDKKGIGDLTTFDENGNLNSIVSISAGTVIPYQYDLEQKAFKSKVENGEEVLINYLPPPFNFGVIPSSNKNSDSLIETIILSSGFSTGTLLSCEILGGFEVAILNTKTTLVICIPTDENVQNIQADNLQELKSKYKNMTRIISLWLVSNNYEMINELNKDETIKLVKDNSLR